MPRRPVHPPASRDAIEQRTPQGDVWAEGQLAQLSDSRGNKYTITLKCGSTFHTHRGLIEHDDIIGAPVSSTVTSSKAIPFLVQRPLLDDYVLSMPRGAAVVYPKDAARIVALADLHPGSNVYEAGVGSGALTCYLLRAVGPTGKVHSVEIREDFAAQASENVCRWFGGWPRSWELTVGDFSEHGTSARADAVVLDMLAPWDCLQVAESTLRPGGVLVAYVATTTQMSRVVETARVTGRWTEPRAEESLLRTWHLDGLSVRPDHKMNGHTGFLITMRRLAPGVEAPARHRRPAPGAYGVDYTGPGGLTSTSEQSDGT